mgnify:CR=1 FL=1
MKKIAVALLSLVVCVFANAQDTLKVMTFNIRFGELASMEEIGEAILKESPDIVMLQECDWGTYREIAPKQNGVKFINVLANHTGMFGLYGKTINYKRGYYGIGLLSRYPIIHSERILLPNKGKAEQRCVLVADVELNSGKIITVASTHLEVSTSELRIAQVKFIEELFKNAPYPVIIAGDMNAEPDSEEMTEMRKNWQDCTNRELTYSTTSPSIKIDYIYTKLSDNSKVIATERIDRYPGLSDHFPVKSTIIIQ